MARNRVACVLSWDGWGRHSGGSFGGTAVTYSFDAGGFRRQRVAGGTTTRYLHGGLFETNGAGTITLTDVDGPASDLAHYAGPPTTSSTVSYRYYNGHGDLAAEADSAGARTAAFTYDPFGKLRSGTAPSNATSERWTGRWDKKLDSSSGLIEPSKAARLHESRPFDNAMSESVISNLEEELLKRRSWKTREEARLAVFTYIETFYNPGRYHSSLGYLSPDAYEKMIRSESNERPGVATTC